MKRRIDLGILYSRSGTYVALSEALHTGAMAAVAAINSDPDSGIHFTAIERDPAGDLSKYAPLCSDILTNSDARHVIGCVTSSSRKEVIPALDRASATLWYNVPYEGFESSARVIYSHACTNQNILPLLGWAQHRYGNRAYLLGSNYIWGWETCRVARLRLEHLGGVVLGERFLPLGDEAVDGLIAEIEATRPNFVLNSLVGASSYAFIRAYKALGKRDDFFNAHNCSVLSCNLTEAELPVLGEAAEGLVSVGPSFSEGDVSAGRGSSLEAAAYGSVITLARMMNEDPELPFDTFVAREGARFGIDPVTQHRTLDVKIAQVRNGRFEVLKIWQGIEPDPYMTRPSRHPQFQQPHLRVVSR